MWHEIWDTIRSNADKILDNALGLLRDAFILVLGVHYRNHVLRRKLEAQEHSDRHTAAEEQIRELRDWMESEKRREAQGDGSGEATGQEGGVDSKSDPNSYHRGSNRVRKP